MTEKADDGMMGAFDSILGKSSPALVDREDHGERFGPEIVLTYRQRERLQRMLSVELVPKAP